MGKHIRISLVLMIIMLCCCTGCTKQTEDDSPALSFNSMQPTQLREPLSVRLNVPSTIQGEFCSESGVSRVFVDANIVVPEATSINIYQAIPRTISDVEISEFVQRHTANRAWFFAKTGEAYNGEGLTVESTPSGIDMYRLFINTDDEALTEYESIYISYGMDPRSKRLAFRPSLTYNRGEYKLSADYLIPLTDNKADGCSISLEEAMKYANQEVLAIAPDYQLAAYGQLPGWETNDCPAYYAFRYTRYLDGIPVSDSYGAEDAEGDYSYIAGLGVITVIVRDDGVCYLEYTNPYDVGEIVEADTELLSFEDIWDIFCRLGLLSIQHLEIDESLQKNELSVYEIRFGYMAVAQADGTYQYIPVWDFYGKRILSGTGGYANAPKEDPIEGLSHLTINAITGTIIDRDMGY